MTVVEELTDSFATSDNFNEWERWVVQHKLKGKRALLFKNLQAFLTTEGVIYCIDESAIENTWQEFDEGYHRLHNDSKRFDGIVEAKRLIDLQS